MPERELSPRAAASVLAGYLGRAINPGGDKADAPIAAALLSPVARLTVEMWVRDGYRLVKRPRESPDSPGGPSLTLVLRTD